MNSKERRFWQRLPDGLKEVLAGLPVPATIESFEAFGRRWSARIQCAGRQFEIGAGDRDREYIDVSEIVVTANRPAYRKIMPPDDQLVHITPAQVCVMMRRELADPNTDSDGGA